MMRKLMEPSEICQQITFLHSSDLKVTKHFYNGLLGLEVVRDQGTCLIFKVTPSAFLGFCEHIEPLPAGRRIILTLVTEDVDQWYLQLKKNGASIEEPPKANPKFQIYHFFLKDPDGYWIEFQRFDHPLSG
jgi:catechol 2,3-dioxygenase-like lactoylglutathione lyase family enzyme